MSIIHAEPEFAIIDEQKYYAKVFEKLSLKIRPQLFEIHSKFMPDSQFAAIQKRRATTTISRKRRLPTGNSEDVTWIQSISTKIREAGIKCAHFQAQEEPKDNNLSARKAAEKVPISLSSAMTSSEQIVEFERFERLENLMCNGMISNWIRNSGEVPAIVENSDGIKFYVPPKSTFHVGDVTDVHQYSSIHEIQFDLIVADPPWMSKSVKRKKTYEMNDEILNQLDLPSIATRDALIAFWLTNRSGLEQEMEQRFAEWGMQVIGNWKWLKLTTQGEPVYDFDNSKHKVPFETLVFAVKKAEREDKFANFPRKFVFASIPMAVHSHKPPIFELLDHFGIKFSRPLELFARSLLPGTHSVGYEPFLLNSEFVFF